MSAPAPYVVAPVDAAHNEALFVGLRRASLGPEATNDALYRWQYQEAPDPADALVLRTTQDDEAVGWVSVQPHRLAVDGKVRRAGLLVNLVVVPEHRTVLPALQLQRAATQWAREAYDLSYGYPNRAALGGFVRAGYRKMGAIRRYACPLGEFGLQLSKAGVEPHLAAVAGVGADALSPLGRKALWLRWRRRYDLEWLDHADERLDGLWESAVAESRGRIVGDRSAAFVEWRLVRHPQEGHRLALLVDRRGGRAVGHAAVLRIGGRARIDDFFALDGAYEPLLDGLLASASADGAEGVELGYLGRREVVEVLQSRGFRAREELRSVIVDAGKVDLPWLMEPERWHLTSADGDL